MRDVGDYIIAKDINGNQVTIPKVNDMTMDSFLREASIMGFPNPLAALLHLKHYMDALGWSYDSRTGEAVEAFLEGLME